MEKHNGDSIAPRKPIWISEEESIFPEQVLEEFFENYTLKEIDDKLWAMLVTVLSSDNGDYQTGLERAGVLLLYERLQQLVEAAYYIKNPR